MRVSRRVLLFVSLIVFILLAVAAWTAYRFMSKPLLRAPASLVFYIHPGESFKQIVRRLSKQATLDSPLYFRLYARLTFASAHLQSGEYQLTNRMNPPELLRHWLQGEVLSHRFTLVEGWRFNQVRQALSQAPSLKHHLVSVPALMRHLGSQHTSPEGLFFPETYQYHWGDSDVDLLERAYAKMQTVLKQEWLMRDGGLPYKTAYQALIAASLVETEAAVAEERGQVAGVLRRRLERRMRLQMDPSVKYGLGLALGEKLTKKQLRQKTPYNTYRIHGLPPTPIAMPGQASIYAALHPAAGNALYYVSRGDGRHVFSAHYKAHQQAVRRYILKRR